MAAQFESVEAMLGVPPQDVGSRLGLARSIEGGLSVAAVDRIARAVAPGDSGFKFRIVPKATLDRRRKGRQRLTSAEGDRVARLAKVYGMALSIYRDEARVRDFLTRPHMLLGNAAPLDVALATGPGADAVVNLLGRAAYSGGA